MSADTLTYLSPVIFRRGQPVMHFCRKRQIMEQTYYEMGVFHTLNLVARGHEAGTGKSSDYDGCSSNVISKELYDALMRESKRNHKKYRVTPA